MIAHLERAGNGSHSDNPTLAAARAYRAGGLSVVPIKRDGSKAPSLQSWQRYQSTPPRSAVIDGWFDRPEPPGIGVVCGAVSGGLECLDFDARAEEVFHTWCEL